MNLSTVETSPILSNACQTPSRTLSALDWSLRARLATALAAEERIEREHEPPHADKLAEEVAEIARKFADEAAKVARKSEGAG